MASESAAQLTHANNLITVYAKTMNGQLYILNNFNPIFGLYGFRRMLQNEYPDIFRESKMLGVSKGTDEEGKIIPIEPFNDQDIVTVINMEEYVNPHHFPEYATHYGKGIRRSIIREFNDSWYQISIDEMGNTMQVGSRVLIIRTFNEKEDGMVECIDYMCTLLDDNKWRYDTAVYLEGTKSPYPYHYDCTRELQDEVHEHIRIANGVNVLETGSSALFYQGLREQRTRMFQRSLRQHVFSKIVFQE
jgi:hypothetical protein